MKSFTPKNRNVFDKVAGLNEPEPMADESMGAESSMPSDNVDSQWDALTEDMSPEDMRALCDYLSNKLDSSEVEPLTYDDSAGEPEEFDELA